MFIKVGCFEILESQIEAKLKREVESLGGMCLKLISPSMAGMPDRLVLLPLGIVSFVELKSPGKKLRPLQRKRKKQLEKLGFKVYVIDSYEGVETLLQEVVK